MKRTLLDDLLKVYYSIPCETYENVYCESCSCCKNRCMCLMLGNLIHSMRKYY